MRDKYHNKIHNGFSLIEIMIVSLILGILAVGGFPLLMGYSHEVQLEHQAHMFYQDLCLVRNSVMAKGEGIATMRFIPNMSGDIVAYEMIGPTGENIRSALMDECVSGFWRYNLASHSVCIRIVTPASLPGSMLQFNRDGKLVSPAGQPVRLAVLFYNGNQVFTDPGIWLIDILTNSTTIQIRRGP